VGKIILTGISSIVFLVWRWVQNRYDAIEAEELVEAHSFVSPWEMDELRKENDWSPQKLSELIRTFYEHHPFSSDDMEGLQDPSISYQDFISFLQQHLDKPIHMAFVLDRIMLGSPRQGTKLTLAPPHPAIRETVLNENIELKPYVHEFYLVTLLSLVTCSLEEKTKLLLQIFRREEEGTLRPEEIARLTTFLKFSFQLPSAVQVVRTEKYLPYQEHREAVAEEIMKNGFVVGLGKEEPPSLTDEDTMAIFLSSKDVCAWGECYRRKNS
jgi:hypothetical protein